MPQKLRQTRGAIKIFHLSSFSEISCLTTKLMSTRPFKKFLVLLQNLLFFKVADLQGKDIICVTYYQNWPANLTTEMLIGLRNYVQNGGSILFGSIGWAWRIYGEGSKNSSLLYELNFASHVIAKQFDIYMRENGTYISDHYIVYQNLRQTDIQNFLKNDYLNVLKGQTAFTANETKVDEYIKRIGWSKNISSICNISFYHTLVDAFIQSRFNIETNYDLIPPDNKFYHRVLKIINEMSYLVPPFECRAIPPSLNIFPGLASKIIPNKTVSVYKNLNQRIYTGLYINPGQAIRITHNNSFINIDDVSIVFNHGDNLFEAHKDNGNLRRFPDVVRQFKIKSRNMTIASTHGGIIYFNENIHNAAQFVLILQIDAPIFVFQTKKFVLVGPTLGVFGSIIIKLAKLCNFWTKVVETYKQEIYDLFVEQLSLVVDQNLWDYFYNWDYPVTDASKEKISHFQNYYCSRHPQLTP